MAKAVNIKGFLSKPVVWIVGIVLLVLLIIYLQYRADKKKTEAMLQQLLASGGSGNPNMYQNIQQQINALQQSQQNAEDVASVETATEITQNFTNSYASYLAAQGNPLTSLLYSIFY